MSVLEYLRYFENNYFYKLVFTEYYNKSFSSEICSLAVYLSLYLKKYRVKV